MDHSKPMPPNGVYQLWITRGEGRVHITEVEPGIWREYVFDEGFNGKGNWYQRHNLDMTPRPCGIQDIPPKLREACKMALTW